MTTLKIDGRTLACALRFSPRRSTVQIRVMGPDCLQITAPTGMAWSRILPLIEGKAAWIRRQLERIGNMAADPANASLTHGSSVLFEGTPHTLLLLADGRKNPHVTYARCAISLHLTELVGQDNDPLVYRSLRDWYVEQARQRLLERTVHWSALIGVRPGRISLRDQRTRWGSCSSRGCVSYNWRIIMAPPAVLDYLVVHELCHLLHPNHSSAYWAEVSRWDPGFREHRLWLRQNGGLLGRLFHPVKG